MDRILVRAGQSRDTLATPCLLIDLDKLDKNIALMAELCDAAKVSLRPHAKAHKTAEIARRQISAGAVGVCVATVGEAETLALAGIEDFLLTSTVGDQDKVERLAALALRGIRLRIVVDCLEMVELFSSVAAAKSVRFDLLIDVDMGRHRAGVASVNEAISIGARIQDDRNLRLSGIQAYAGHLSHMRDHALRREGVAEANTLIQTFRDGLSDLIDGRVVVTGGSTGTSLLDLSAGVYTELQFGSYALMDVEYRLVDIDGRGTSPFEPALFLQSSVISNRHQGFVTTDGGDKRLASKYNEQPLVWAGAPEGSTYRSLSDEHGQVMVPPGTELQLGARVECVVPHCDPTINLFDKLVVVEKQMVVDVWPVTARGA